MAGIVPDGLPEYYLGGADPVFQSGVLRCVRGALLNLSVFRVLELNTEHILPEHPVGTLDPELYPLVPVGKVIGELPVVHAPLLQEYVGVSSCVLRVPSEATSILMPNLVK